LTSTKEVVDPGGDLRESLAQAGWCGQQLEPTLERLAREEPFGEQTELRTGEEHDRCPPPPEPLRAGSAVRKKVEQLVHREIAGERREPDLETGGRRIAGRDPESLPIAAGEAHGRAVEIVVDDAHLALHHARVEGFAGAHSGVQEAGVVGDALGSHEIDALFGWRSSNHGLSPVQLRTGVLI
jgi:hypothetical protein